MKRFDYVSESPTAPSHGVACMTITTHTLARWLRKARRCFADNQPVDVQSKGGQIDRFHALAIDIIRVLSKKGNGK